jgi:hypothetical protein
LSHSSIEQAKWATGIPAIYAIFEDFQLPFQVNGIPE